MVCCEHFNDNQFKRNNKTEINSDAIPIIIGNTQEISIEENQNDVVVTETIEPIEPIPALTSTLSASDAKQTFVSNNSTEAVHNVEGMYSDYSCNATGSMDGTNHSERSEQCEAREACKACVKKDYLVSIQEDTIKELRKKLKKANNKIWYLESTKRKLDATISEMKEQQLINQDLVNGWQPLKDNELLRVLHSGIKSGEKYPANIRHFCLGLVYHSPRAYEHVRKTFNNHLPNIKTIRSWFANSDIKSDPGIQQEHIERLKKIVHDFENKYNRKLLCSLIFDEMHIRQQLVFLAHQMDFSGFANYEQNPKNEKNVIAKQAIVIILKGIEANFEFPIAYFFIDTLTKFQRKNLVQDIIATVIRCGVKISNITFDGLAANAAMCVLLGANLDVYNVDFQHFIFDPINKEKIYIILDPCHMEKIVRNTLSNRKEFFADKKNNKIEWELIESLYEFSRENNFKTHKLTKKHVEWKRNPMNVRLASQTFSNSVADSLQFLMDQGIPEFQGAEATIDFVRRMDKLFNIFNSKYSNEKDVFKRVLTDENKRVVFNFLQNMIQYFKSLKVEEEYFIGKKNQNQS